MKRGLALITAALLGSCATPQQPRALEIALTIDDLPVHGPIPAGESPKSVADDVIAALITAHVPAYGFVNAHWTAEQPGTLDVLRAWRRAGLALGNHTWSHRHLSEMSIADFEREVARDELVLQQLAGSSDWHWFRYPFLDEGDNAEKRVAARHVLARRGYKIAAVTMDFGDWQWTAPYARCMAAGDQAALDRLERIYLDAAGEAISYSRTLSRQLYGRDIPYVVLLHDSAFEARMLPQLIGLYRAAGFRLVSLPEAERDPAYADQVRPDSPAEAMGLEGKAAARGISLPRRTDFAPQLAAICPGRPGATSP
ncbi:polysaccharide deacetylase family protein [Sphingomonas sp.]|uniref:polysaccharide deacetylase family protein n=1 Tax=Sphingomonas sp. TaxID=28214 RepID=UPI0038A2CE66